MFICLDLHTYDTVLSQQTPPPACGPCSLSKTNTPCLLPLPQQQQPEQCVRASPPLPPAPLQQQQQQPQAWCQHGAPSQPLPGCSRRQGLAFGARRRALPLAMQGRRRTGAAEAAERATAAREEGAACCSPPLLPAPGYASAPSRYNAAATVTAVLHRPLQGRARARTGPGSLPRAREECAGLRHSPGTRAQQMHSRLLPATPPVPSQ